MTKEAQQETEATYKPTARDAAIEAMAEAKNQRMLEELAANEKQETTEPVVPVAEPVAEVIPEPKAEDQVTKQMRKVKVDGEEMEVSEDDLVASYQKQAAATRRLQSAQVEAQQIKDAALAEATRIIDEAKIKVAPEPVKDEDRAAKRKAYHAALFAGDEEAADKLFDELTSMGRPTPIPNADELVAQVVPKVKQVVKQELDNDSALSKFESDYKDIVDDPYLVSVTQAHLQQAMSEGKPYAEALFVAGNATRDWLKSKVPSTSPEPTTTTRAERLERKAGIDNIPTANSKATTQPEPEETTSAIVMQMRKARGMA